MGQLKVQYAYEKHPDTYLVVGIAYDNKKRQKD